MRKAHLILILATLLFTLIHSEIIAIQTSNITKQHDDPPLLTTSISPTLLTANISPPLLTANISPPLLTANISNNNIDQHSHDNDTNSTQYTVRNLTRPQTENRNSSHEAGANDSPVDSTSDQHDTAEQSHPIVGKVPNPHAIDPDYYDSIFQLQSKIVSNHPAQQALSANSQSSPSITSDIPSGRYIQDNTGNKQYLP